MTLRTATGLILPEVLGRCGVKFTSRQEITKSWAPSISERGQMLRGAGDGATRITVGPQTSCKTQQFEAFDNKNGDRID